ncbi:MAG: ribonuclease III domain-containing protein [Eubacteriales bacterium]|nr:ribonuclease III domain-containing protein [Eubacteriales bacterium]
MEESIINEISSLTLAYIGDAVFELEIRNYYLQHGSKRIDKINKRVVSTVNAKNQSLLVDKILPHLSETEEGVYRRGRNSKAMTSAKHTTISEYKRATGLEALFGFLYLCGYQERIKELIEICFDGEAVEEA